jgi:pimeloyl-ACP methyl ester carboxylesterase
MANVHSFDGTNIAFGHHAARTPDAITAVIAACQVAAFNRFEEVMRKTSATAAMDMRGSGASASPKSKWDFSVPAYAKDIAAVIDATKAHKAALVSYSHASEGAVHLAITQPHKVAALVLIEPGLFVSRAHLLERVKLADDGRIEEALRLALSFANPGLTGKELEEGAQFVLNTYGKQPENIVGEWRARAEYRVSDKQLAQISVPTLVIGGTHSNIRDDVARTAAAIPNASLFWLRGATHFLNEEQGKTAAEITSSFLSHAL